MKIPFLMIICALALAGAGVPGAGAVDPLWVQPATPGNSFSMLVVSEDGSTIVAGGDQMMALDREGKKRWAGWSSGVLAIDRNGGYILSSQAQILRLFSGNGILLWDQSIDTPVTDISISPDGTIIAVSGAGVVRTLASSGEGIGSNATPGVNHIRVSPARDQIIVTTASDVRRDNLSVVPKWWNDNSSQDLVDISGDGTTFVTVTFNRVWRYHAGGALLWEQIVPGGNALALAYSGDGSTIVLGRDDNTVRTLDQNGSLLWTAKAGGWVTSVAVSDDGSLIAAGDINRNLYFFDHAGNLLGTFTTAAPIKSRSLGMSGDGSVIAAADMTAVYGFSRSQFSPQVIPVLPVSAPVTVAVTTTIPPAATETTAPPVSTAATTTRAGIFPLVPVLSLVILSIVCHGRRH